MSHRNKAVAIGAVSYYVDHFVKGRISKFTYGVLGAIPYNPSNPQHARRIDKLRVDAVGGKRVPGYFDAMLPRVRVIQYFFGFLD